MTLTEHRKERPVMPEPELKHCPFCGGPAMFRKSLWPSDGNTDAIIHAGSADTSTCGLIQFSTDTTDESVIAAWNTRAAHPNT